MPKIMLPDSVEAVKTRFFNALFADLGKTRIKRPKLRKTGKRAKNNP